MTTKKEIKQSRINSGQWEENMNNGAYAQSNMIDECASHQDSVIFRNVGIGKESVYNQNQNGIMIDQSDDNNDDYCCICVNPGFLKQCCLCLRVFHRECGKLNQSQFQGQIICQYCKLKKQKKCAVCNLNLISEQEQKIDQMIINTEPLPPSFLSSNLTLPEYYLICTMCFSEVHYSCSNVPIEVLKLKSFFFTGIENYVCLDCISIIDSVRIMGTHRYLHKQTQVLYYFLNVNSISLSPIHCFWMAENDLIKRKKNNTIRFSSSMKSQHDFKDTIENVLDFRSPFSLRKNQFCQQAKILKEKILKGQNSNTLYGSFQNYRFLVRWKKSKSYAWQDQKVVFSYIFPLKKFIVKCIFERSVLQEQPKPLSQLHSQIFDQTQIQQYTRSIMIKKKTQKLLYISFGPQPAVYETLEKNSNVRNVKIENILKIINEKKSIEIIEKNNLQNSCVQVLTKCIKELYLGNGSKKGSIMPQITIIITIKQEIQKWMNELRLICPLLQVLLMTEDTNIEMIKKRQFLFSSLFYPQFQILLITSKIYLQEQSFITGKIKGIRNILSNKLTEPPITHLIILDNAKEDFLAFQQARFPDFHKFFLLKQGKNSYLESQIHNHFQNTQIYKFLLQSPHHRSCIYSKIEPERHREIFNRQCYNRENNYSKQVKWSQSQRIAFHTYILAFGANQFRNVQECLAKLHIQYPEVFRTASSAQLKKQCAKYLQLYFKLIRDWRGGSIPFSNDTSQFLFGIQRQKVYKRVCQLNKMKSTVEEHNQNPNRFPFKIPWKLFISKEIVSVKSWGSLQDYILCRLVLKHGFGNWDKMLNDRSYWCIFIGPNYKGRTFQNYVLEMLEKKKGEKHLDLRSIIEDRAYNCLQLMN